MGADTQMSMPHGRFFGRGSVRRESAGFLLDCLQPTAASHSRVMVLEVMGRDAGHIE